MSLGSHIAHLQHRAARKLLLDIEVVVFHVRRLDIAVESEHIALKTEAIGRVIYRLSRIERARNDGWNNLRVTQSNRVISRAGSEENRIRQMVQDHVLGESIKKHAEPCAHYRPALATHVPCQAGAGSEILIVRVVG